MGIVVSFVFLGGSPDTRAVAAVSVQTEQVVLTTKPTFPPLKTSRCSEREGAAAAQEEGVPASRGHRVTCPGPRQKQGATGTGGSDRPQGCLNGPLCATSVRSPKRRFWRGEDAHLQRFAKVQSQVQVLTGMGGGDMQVGLPGAAETGWHGKQ